MAQSVARDLHVDQMLTNISLGYRNPNYIADEIFPVVPVNKQSDLLAEYDQSHWFRLQAEKRAAGAKSARAGFKVSKDRQYYCHKWSLGFEIDDDSRANQDAPFDMDRDGTEFVTDQMLLAREVNLATNYFTTGVWGTDKVGTSHTDFYQFDDYANSTPLAVITAYKDAIEGRIGMEPNKLVLGKQVYSALKWHPDLVDTIKYTQRGQLTPDLIAALLEFSKLLIGRAIKTTSVEGTAEADVAYTRIWGKNALMLYTPDAPSLMKPSAGYTFIWRQIAGLLQYIKRMRDEERETDILEGNSHFDQKITGAAGGLFLSAAVS